MIIELKAKLDENYKNNRQMLDENTKLKDTYSEEIQSLNLSNIKMKKLLEESQVKKLKHETLSNEKVNEQTIKLERQIEEKDSVIKEKDDLLNNLEKDFIQFKNNERILCEEKLSLVCKVRGSLKSLEEFQSRTSDLDKDKNDMRKAIEASNLKVKNLEEEIITNKDQYQRNYSHYNSSIEK